MKDYPTHIGPFILDFHYRGEIVGNTLFDIDKLFKFRIYLYRILLMLITLKIFLKRCGLVALCMAAKLLGKDVKPAEALAVAQDENFSKQGEMFSGKASGIIIVYT